MNNFTFFFIVTLNLLSVNCNPLFDNCFSCLGFGKEKNTFTVEEVVNTYLKDIITKKNIDTEDTITLEKQCDDHEVDEQSALKMLTEKYKEFIVKVADLTNNDEEKISKYLDFEEKIEPEIGENDVVPEIGENDVVPEIGENDVVVPDIAEKKIVESGVVEEMITKALGIIQRYFTEFDDTPDITVTKITEYISQFTEEETTENYLPIFVVYRMQKLCPDLIKPDKEDMKIVLKEKALILYLNSLPSSTKKPAPLDSFVKESTMQTKDVLEILKNEYKEFVDQIGKHFGIKKSETKELLDEEKSDAVEETVTKLLGKMQGKIKSLSHGNLKTVRVNVEKYGNGSKLRAKILNRIAKEFNAFGSTEEGVKVAKIYINGLGYDNTTKKGSKEPTLSDLCKDNNIHKRIVSNIIIDKYNTFIGLIMNEMNMNEKLSSQGKKKKYEFKKIDIENQDEKMIDNSFITSLKEVEKQFDTLSRQSVIDICDHVQKYIYSKTEPEWSEIIFKRIIRAKLTHFIPIGVVEEVVNSYIKQIDEDESNSYNHFLQLCREKNIFVEGNLVFPKRQEENVPEKMEEDKIREQAGEYYDWLQEMTSEQDDSKYQDWLLKIISQLKVQDRTDIAKNLKNKEKDTNDQTRQEEPITNVIDSKNGDHQEGEITNVEDSKNEANQEGEITNAEDSKNEDYQERKTTSREELEQERVFKKIALILLSKKYVDFINEVSESNPAIKESIEKINATNTDEINKCVLETLTVVENNLEGFSRKTIIKALYYVKSVRTNKTETSHQVFSILYKKMPNFPLFVRIEDVEEVLKPYVKCIEMEELATNTTSPTEEKNDAIVDDIGEGKDIANEIVEEQTASDSKDNKEATGSENKKEKHRKCTLEEELKNHEHVHKTIALNYLTQKYVQLVMNVAGDIKLAIRKKDTYQEEPEVDEMEVLFDTITEPIKLIDSSDKDENARFDMALEALKIFQENFDKLPTIVLSSIPTLVSGLLVAKEKNLPLDIAGDIFINVIRERKPDLYPSDEQVSNALVPYFNNIDSKNSSKEITLGKECSNQNFRKLIALRRLSGMYSWFIEEVVRIINSSKEYENKKIDIAEIKKTIESHNNNEIKMDEIVINTLKPVYENRQQLSPSALQRIEGCIIRRIKGGATEWSGASMYRISRAFPDFVNGSVEKALIIYLNSLDNEKLGAKKSSLPEVCSSFKVDQAVALNKFAEMYKNLVRKIADLSEKLSELSTKINEMDSKTMDEDELDKRALEVLKEIVANWDKLPKQVVKDIQVFKYRRYVKTSEAVELFLDNYLNWQFDEPMPLEEFISTNFEQLVELDDAVELLHGTCKKLFEGLEELCGITTMKSNDDSTVFDPNDKNKNDVSDLLKAIDILNSKYNTLSVEKQVQIKDDNNNYRQGGFYEMIRKVTGVVDSVWNEKEDGPQKLLYAIVELSNIEKNPYVIGKPVAYQNISFHVLSQAMANKSTEEDFANVLRVLNTIWTNAAKDNHPPFQPVLSDFLINKLKKEKENTTLEHRIYFRLLKKYTKGKPNEVGLFGYLRSVYSEFVDYCLQIVFPAEAHLERNLDDEGLRKPTPSTDLGQ